MWVLPLASAGVAKVQLVPVTVAVPSSAVPS
ncbi:Uncharacterised protein [Mycobacterium tuberculosis]|nr:Uncharacterised protein [Mycobacterium tuberculosis]